MVDYPANSKSPKATSKPQEKVDKGIKPIAAPGEATLRSKPLGRRFKDAFVGEDGRSVASHVFWSVILPGAKALAANAAKDSIDRLFYGPDAIPHGRTIGTLAQRINYAGISSSPRVTVSDPRVVVQQQQQTQREPLRTTVGQMDYQDIVLSSMALWEEAIDQMNEIISKFGKVSVADLFDIVGITGTWTDNQIGWTDLAGARVDRVSGGWVAVLPRPVQLD